MRLRLRFIERARDQLAALKAHAETCDTAASQTNADLVKIVHSLSGAAGTFGFPEVSRRAFELETALTAPEGSDPAAVRQHLGDLITELEAALV